MKDVKSRAIICLEDFIKSEATKKSYFFHLEKFRIFLEMDTIDDILLIDSKDLQDHVKDYVRIMKDKDLSHNYIRGITFAFQSLCDSNEKMGINWKMVRKMLDKKHKPKKTRPYTTDEVKRMLNTAKGLRNKAIILFLSSSAVRRGVISELKIKDMKQMPLGCVAITAYSSDSNEEYVTFINKEANDVLSLYIQERQHKGEIITPESPVFATKNTEPNGKIKHISEASVSNMMLRTKINAGVNFDGVPNLLCHALRRRWNTVMKLNKKVNTTIIERLMGHDQKLDNSYFQPTLDELFTEYCKGMADLTIDDSERLLVERKSIEEQKSEFERQKLEQKSMQQEIDIIKENQEKMNRVMDMVREGKVRLVNNNDETINLQLI